MNTNAQGEDQEGWHQPLESPQTAVGNNASAQDGRIHAQKKEKYGTARKRNFSFLKRR